MVGGVLGHECLAHHDSHAGTLLLAAEDAVVIWKVVCLVHNKLLSKQINKAAIII